MGACASSKQEDVFTKHKNEMVGVSTNDIKVFKVVDNVGGDSSLDSTRRDENKMRVMKATKILIIGDNRVKVATACYIASLTASSGVEVIVGTRDPEAAKNSLLLRAGVKIIKADMNSPQSLLPAIRDCGADTVFLVSPNQQDRSAQTTSGITACKRAGVGHVVVLSSTCVERKLPSIFGDQCKQIETFVKTTRGLSYTIVRIPILMDNYLSQLQSMAEYGIFYRPVSPNSSRSAITVSDLGVAVGKILMTPGLYGDKTISLNGPLTNCETASLAFSAAFDKPIIYEQVSYDSYRETLLEASLPEWQVTGILELFKMFEAQEPFCLGSSEELEAILGRPPSTVYDLAIAAVAKTNPRGQSFDSLASDLERSVHESPNSSSRDNPDYSGHGSSRHGRKEFQSDGTTLLPYSRLNILRPIDSTPSSSLSPPGLAGLLKVTLSISSPPISQVVRRRIFIVITFITIITLLIIIIIVLTIIISIITIANNILIDSIEIEHRRSAH
jgi:uncharacterized protein YbjT (DUF2867 family)